MPVNATRGTSLDESEVFGGTKVEAVDLGRFEVDIWVRPHDAEIRRRAECGAGPITNHGQIAALMELPTEMPVSLRALPGWLLLQLDELIDHHAVRVDGEDLLRSAIPPLELIGISKRARRLRDVHSLTALMPHAPLCVLASTSLARRTVRSTDSEVGVAAKSGDLWRVLRPPRGSRVRPSWGRWVLSELAFEAVRSRQH